MWLRDKILLENCHILINLKVCSQLKRFSLVSLCHSTREASTYRPWLLKFELLFLLTFYYLLVDNICITGNPSRLRNMLNYTYYYNDLVRECNWCFGCSHDTITYWRIVVMKSYISSTSRHLMINEQAWLYIDRDLRVYIIIILYQSL